MPGRSATSWSPKVRRSRRERSWRCSRNGPMGRSGMAEGGPVRYSVEDGVAWLVIDRPERRNAIDRAVGAGLWDGFRRFDADPRARVLVLTGAGEAAFCAGADLSEMAAGGLRVPPADMVPQLGANIEIAKPVIAAVNGAAYGGGFLLAQMCDLCVAAEHATFAIAEARWGRGAARAATVAANAPLSVSAAKAMVYRSVGKELREALAEGWRLFEPVYASEDAQEGPRAFVEKRQPEWKGR